MPLLTGLLCRKWAQKAKPCKGGGPTSTGNSEAEHHQAPLSSLLSWDTAVDRIGRSSVGDAAKPHCAPKKKRFFGKEWAVQVFAYVCIGWICHSWEARLLFKSVEGRRLERRCLNVSYWCVENNQLNLVLHCELFAALQQQRKSCTEQSFAVCRWACSLTNQTFVALRVPIAVKNMCAQVGAC